MQAFLASLLLFAAGLVAASPLLAPSPPMSKRAFDNSRWGGAVAYDEQITQVSANIEIPTVTLPDWSDTSTTYYSSAWVGVDGSGSCGSGLFQAGVYWIVTDGVTTYYPFYEWYPASVVLIYTVDVSPGDSLYVNLQVESTTSGTYYLENKSNGQSVEIAISGQAALCEVSAEWIVESNVPGQNPMPNFGTVTFTDATYTAGGQSYDVTNSDIDDITDNDTTYTSCQTSGDSTVQCTWQS